MPTITNQELAEALNRLSTESKYNSIFEFTATNQLSIKQKDLEEDIQNLLSLLSQKSDSESLIEKLKLALENYLDIIALNSQIEELTKRLNTLKSQNLEKNPYTYYSYIFGWLSITQANIRESTKDSGETEEAVRNTSTVNNKSFLRTFLSLFFSSFFTPRQSNSLNESLISNSENENQAASNAPLQSNKEQIEIEILKVNIEHKELLKFKIQFDILKDQKGDKEKLLAELNDYKPQNEVNLKFKESLEEALNAYNPQNEVNLEFKKSFDVIPPIPSSPLTSKYKGGNNDPESNSSSFVGAPIALKVTDEVEKKQVTERKEVEPDGSPHEKEPFASDGNVGVITSDQNHRPHAALMNLINQRDASQKPLGNVATNTSTYKSTSPKIKASRDLSELFKRPKQEPNSNASSTSSTPPAPLRLPPLQVIDSEKLDLPKIYKLFKSFKMQAHDKKDAVMKIVGLEILNEDGETKTENIFMDQKSFEAHQAKLQSLYEIIRDEQGGPLSLAYALLTKKYPEPAKPPQIDQSINLDITELKKNLKKFKLSLGPNEGASNPFLGLLLQKDADGKDIDIFDDLDRYQQNIYQFYRAIEQEMESPPLVLAIQAALQQKYPAVSAKPKPSRYQRQKLDTKKDDNTKNSLEMTIHSTNTSLLSKIEAFLKKNTKGYTRPLSNANQTKFKCAFNRDFKDLYLQFFDDFKQVIQMENLPKLVEFGRFDPIYQKVALNQLTIPEFEKLKLNVSSAKSLDAAIKKTFEDLTKDNYRQHLCSPNEFEKLKKINTVLQEKFKHFEIDSKPKNVSRKNLLLRELDEANILYVVVGTKVIMHQSSEEAVKKIIQTNFFKDDLVLEDSLNQTLPEINIEFPKEITTKLKAVCQNSRFREGEGYIDIKDHAAFQTFLRENTELVNNDFSSTNSELQNSINLLPKVIMLKCDDPLATFKHRFSREMQKLIGEHFISKESGYYVKLDFFEAINLEAHQALKDELGQKLSAMPNARFEPSDEEQSKIIKPLITQIMKLKLIKVVGGTTVTPPARPISTPQSSSDSTLTREDHELNANLKKFHEQLEVTVPNATQKKLTSANFNLLLEKLAVAEVNLADLKFNDYEKWKSFDTSTAKLDLITSVIFENLKERARLIEEIKGILSATAPERRAQEIYEQVFKGKITTVGCLVYTKLYGPNINIDEFNTLKDAIRNMLNDDKAPLEKFKDFLLSHNMGQLSTKLSNNIKIDKNSFDRTLRIVIPEEKNATKFRELLKNFIVELKHRPTAEELLLEEGLYETIIGSNSVSTITDSGSKGSIPVVVAADGRSNLLAAIQARKSKDEEGQNADPQQKSHAAPMASIKDGGKPPTKEPEESKPVAAPAPSDLLAAIVDGKKLKKVEKRRDHNEETVSPEEKERLHRRKNIGYLSDDDDDATSNEALSDNDTTSTSENKIYLIHMSKKQFNSYQKLIPRGECYILCEDKLYHYLPNRYKPLSDPQSLKSGSSIYGYFSDKPSDDQKSSKVPLKEATEEQSKELQHFFSQKSQSEKSGSGSASFNSLFGMKLKAPLASSSTLLLTITMKKEEEEGEYNLFQDDASGQFILKDYSNNVDIGRYKSRDEFIEGCKHLYEIKSFTMATVTYTDKCTWGEGDEWEEDNALSAEDLRKSIAEISLSSKPRK